MLKKICLLLFFKYRVSDLVTPSLVKHRERERERERDRDR